MPKKESYSVLLDTSFLIRLLSAGDELHSNALGYFKYFLENDIPMYVSTISIAEYCVKGDVTEIPLKNIRIIPFNFEHAILAGKYADILYSARSRGDIQIDNRLIIPNDVKLFAQADNSKEIKYFVTSDSKSSLLIDKISISKSVTFKHMDIHTKFSSMFGILDL